MSHKLPDLPIDQKDDLQNIDRNTLGPIMDVPVIGTIQTQTQLRIVGIGELGSESGSASGEQDHSTPSGPKRQRKTVQRVCENMACGRTFPAMAKEVNRGWGRFCSRSCASIPKGKRTCALHPQAGAGNHHFKDWASKRPIVYVNRYQAENPEKVAAQRALAAAIRSGAIVRPAACERCHGTSKRRLDGHHHDYSRPLDVVFVCRRCHGKLDDLRRRRFDLPAFESLNNVEPVTTVLLPVYDMRTALVDSSDRTTGRHHRDHEGLAAPESIQYVSR